MNIPRMGFDQLVYQDDFTVDKTYAGGYVSDDTLADQLIAQFEAKGDGPLFLYGLSMENHQPYYAGKFDTPAPVAAAAEGLTEEEQGVLDALLHGLWDADAALGKLVDYFSQVEEPTILVFVGDHLPGLSLDAGGTLYTSLGYSSTSDTSQWAPEELKRMHATNILVWNNYGAELALPAETSCTLLGTQLLGWAGVPKPLYFQWVDRAMDQMLLYRERLFVTADGTPWHEPTEDCARRPGGGLEEYRLRHALRGAVYHPGPDGAAGDLAFAVPPEPGRPGEGQGARQQEGGAEGEGVPGVLDGGKVPLPELDAAVEDHQKQGGGAAAQAEGTQAPPAARQGRQPQPPGQQAQKQGPQCGQQIHENAPFSRQVSSS